MPVVEGVVEGVGIESIGTELVVGKVEAVGEVLLGLPLMLLSGCGMAGRAAVVRAAAVVARRPQSPRCQWPEP
jgi:hypothetical protein